MRDNANFSLGCATFLKLTSFFISLSIYRYTKFHRFLKLIVKNFFKINNENKLSSSIFYVIRCFPKENQYIKIDQKIFQLILNCFTTLAPILGIFYPLPTRISTHNMVSKTGG